MSCLEKRHTSHRMGSMLHHRFPNGFTDLFMDETDREVSTLTDRAFRSLCIGDDAVYNDDFLYGYSPYSCLKPLAGEPLKKNRPKKAGQHKSEKHDAQPWKQQQQKNISHMSSFLKVLSAAEESCERMLITNGDVTDCNGESWDKSALRSIERELSEFSSDYHTSLTDRHYNSLPHQSASGSSNKKDKDASQPSGKSTKTKNGKSAVKLKKLNIRNFFLHSEFSPFQTWTDFNRYPFGPENTVPNILSTDNIPKWYDFPFYKELTEAHRKETLHTEESNTCQREAAEPSDAKVPKPIPAPPPPKVLPKPSCAPPTEKRCCSDGGDGHAAPWRRRSRAKSAVPVNHPGIPPQESNSKAMTESLLLAKKEVKSVEVKAVEEISSLASTPFSICQLMTPVIPSRQPTETSEVLQAVLSPSVLDLLGWPHSETKGTPEPPVKRESYKSLASSILFNLKDNRKRVKSRYSPPKFKTSEPPDGGSQSPQTDNVTQGASEGSGSSLSTPGIWRDGQPVCSPSVEPVVSPDVDPTKHNSEKPLSDDYLLSNLLLSKRDTGSNSSHGEENPISPFTLSKKNKSPMSKKQNYPSLNLYRKTNPVDSETKYLQIPQSSGTTAKTDPSSETKNRELPSHDLKTNTGLSPGTLNVINDYSPVFSPHTLESLWLSTEEKRLQHVPEKTERVVKDSKEQDLTESEAPKENDPGGQTISTMNLIRAAREAINAAKNKALSATYQDNINKQMTDSEEPRQKETERKASDEMLRSKRESSITENNSLPQNDTARTTLVGKNSHINKEPPPVPKRNFTKSDRQMCLDKRLKADSASNDELMDDTEDLPREEKELKHVFSARQNNSIKHQRHSVTDDGQVRENEDSRLNVNTGREADSEMTSSGEIRDSEHIFNDLKEALKELEEVRLGDRTLENVKSKQEVVKIDEEAKAKNDLISRELRNIKKGMLSMRGNTSAKRKIFAKQEKEQRKQEAFTKLDSSVIVNKTLLNDNYDKAKLALEEVISEREKRRKKFTEQDSVPVFEENVNDRSSETWGQEGRKTIKDRVRGLADGQKDITSKTKEKDDPRDKHQLRNTLAQTHFIPGEIHRFGGKVELPGMNTVTNELNPLLKVKQARGKSADNRTQNTETHLKGKSKSSEESGNFPMSERVKFDAPPVPPRNKKGGSKRDGSVTEEKIAEDDIVYSKVKILENPEEQSGLTKTSSETKEAHLSRSEERQDEVIDANLKAFTAAALCLSPKLRGNKNTEKSFPTNTSPIDNTDGNVQETCKKKRKAPLKPDHLIRPDDNTTMSLKLETEMISDNVNVDPEVLFEVPRSVVSPLLLVNGVSITQSPPDQASLSSKSSYFSVESALHRNTETESNVYHSLENSPQTVSQKDLDRAEGKDYSSNDHEWELEDTKQQVKSPPKEPEDTERKNKENVTAYDRVAQEESASAMSPSGTFSQNLGIPVLFKVKDNTFSNKMKKPMAPWSPRGSLNEPERVEEELHQEKEDPELSVVNETPTISTTTTTSEIFKPTDISTSQLPALLLSPSGTLSENQKTPQIGSFLTVPQEEDRFSRVTPSSEGIESLTTSAGDTVDDVAANTSVLVDGEGTKAPSEHSGSICSGSDSQTGQPKPPAVLPKSEKAVQKAIKLTNRRMKKEEAQKSTQISSKHRADRPKSDKLEQKTSSSAKTGRNGEKKRREKEHHNESHHSNDSLTQKEQLPSYNENRRLNAAETSQKTRRQSHDSVDNSDQRKEAPRDVSLERPGRSCDRHVGDQPVQRRYSSDRIISNVPVYKAHIEESPTSDRSFHRSQSIDRYLGGKPERRLSADVSVSEKLEPRTQRIEKSIVHELQQRGRAKDKASRGNLLRRSHSIDAYSTEAPPLSRQSSHTSQLSRQSSLEHTIVTQSFPMTQRKLLQDPDSGQYYFVDLPVQVKTKTFIDPHTGSYVQLPVQPPDGAVPPAPHVEVLTQPMVVYHSFVPVPLSPMAQKTTIQASYREADDMEQRHLGRARQMLCKEGHPFFDPAYSQHEHVLGEFLGTEELDCPS